MKLFVLIIYRTTHGFTINGQTWARAKRRAFTKVYENLLVVDVQINPNQIERRMSGCHL